MVHYKVSIKRFREEFSPCSLEELCTQVCVTNAESIFFEQVNADQWSLKEETLPSYLEEVWKRYDHSAPEYLPMMMEIVGSTQITLKRIDLSNSKLLNDEHLENLMRILPVSLALNNCPQLTNEAFNIINRYGKNLVSLHLGTSAAHVIPKDVQDWMDCTGGGIDDGLLKTPKLVKLSMWGLKVNQYQQISYQNPIKRRRGQVEGSIKIDFWEILTRAFAPNLVHLDISECGVVQNLSFLARSENTLRSLHLSNVLKHEFDRGTWGILVNLREIRFLDISSYRGFVWGPRPMDVSKQFVDTLVNTMPKLECLDKAGLRLVGETAPSKKMQALKLLPLCEAVGNDDIQQFLTDMTHYSQKRNGAYTTSILIVLLRRIKLGVPFMPLNSIIESVMELLKNHEHPIIQVAGMKLLLEAIKTEPDLGTSLRQRLFRLARHSMNKCFSNVATTESGVLLSAALSTGIPAWDPSFAKEMIATLLRASKNAIITLAIDTQGSKRNILARVPKIILDNVDQLTASQITTLSLKNDILTLYCTLSRMENMHLVAERYGQLYLRFNPDGQENLSNANDHMVMEVLALLRHYRMR